MKTTEDFSDRDKNEISQIDALKKNLIKETKASRSISARKKSNTLKGNVRYVIFLDKGNAVKETTFNNFVLHGFECRAKELGFNMLVTYFEADGDWELQIKDLCADVSGLVVLATELQKKHVKLAIDAGIGKFQIPMVFIDNNMSTYNFDCVNSDNFQSVYIACSYLLRNKHPDLGCFHSSTNIYSMGERFKGFERACLENNSLPTDKSRVIELSISASNAYQDMSLWLDNGNIPVSAYFAENDMIASGAMRALIEHGYKIPQDIEIFGFDDLPICTIMVPSLSSIRIEKEAIGGCAMDILSKRIEDNNFNISDKRDGSINIEIQARLINRESARIYG